MLYQPNWEPGTMTAYRVIRQAPNWLPGRDSDRCQLLLVELDVDSEECAEAALAETLVALPLDDLEEDRPDHVPA